VCRYVEALERRGLFRFVENDEKEYQTGYRSRHFVGHLAPVAWQFLNLDPAQLETIWIEIQVRTLLEEAWGEIEHPLVYKSHYQLSPDLRDGFISLSSRLHAANVFAQQLQRRVDEERGVRPQRRIADEQTRSFSIDAARLGVSEAAAPEVQARLARAEQARSERRCDDAAREHAALLDDPACGLARMHLVLRCELGLDHLLQARLWHAEDGALSPRTREALDHAERELAAARVLDRERKVVFIPWRMATVAAMRGDLRAALDHDEQADRIFLEHGVPDFVTAALHRGAILTRIGARRLELWLGTDRLDDGQRREAERILREACADLERIGAADDGRAHSEDWMLDYLTAENNLAYCFYVTGRHREAAAAIDRVRKRVDSAVFEHDPYFIDTRIAVELATLSDSPSVDRLVKLDAWRSRLLDLLTRKGAALVFARDARSMLEHIQACERRLHELVRARFKLDGQGR
jgi:tetratricopeptide (TPR) repeat protein